MHSYPPYERFRRRGKASSLLTALADLIWPPLSPLSGRPVSAPGELDGPDWSGLTFIDAPFCESCGTPFSYHVGEGVKCPACIARAPAWDRARSALVYNAHSRALPLALKHAGRTDALPAFAHWMVRAGRDFINEADLLVPVPLHPRRLRQRRFNQSLLLARSVSKISGVPVDPHSLARIRATPTQGGLTGKARVRNVAGAFRIRSGRASHINGKSLILIDDVHTTGATLNACARALKRAGAANVCAITLARVVKPVDVLK